MESIVSSASRVWGSAPAANTFWQNFSCKIDSGSSNF